jgi:hypothetical protein
LLPVSFGDSVLGAIPAGDFDVLGTLFLHVKKQILRFAQDDTGNRSG